MEVSRSLYEYKCEPTIPKQEIRLSTITVHYSMDCIYRTKYAVCLKGRCLLIANNHDEKLQVNGLSTYNRENDGSLYYIKFILCWQGKYSILTVVSSMRRLNEQYQKVHKKCLYFRFSLGCKNGFSHLEIRINFQETLFYLKGSNLWTQNSNCECCDL